MTDQQIRLVRSDPPAAAEDDSVKWLALLFRQAFLLIVSGIERRYGLKRTEHS